jgi:hypothetical protein
LTWRLTDLALEEDIEGEANKKLKGAKKMEAILVAGEDQLP